MIDRNEMPALGEWLNPPIPQDKDTAGSEESNLPPPPEPIKFLSQMIQERIPGSSSEAAKFFAEYPIQLNPLDLVGIFNPIPKSLLGSGFLQFIQWFAILVSTVSTFLCFPGGLV